jgi:membrane-bound lytic murein transglycosylase A
MNQFNAKSMSWIILSLVFALLLASCSDNEDGYRRAFPFPEDISKNGKRKHAPRLAKVYTYSQVDKLVHPSTSPGLIRAIRQQKKLLNIQRRGRKYHNIGGLKFSKQDLERTAEAMENWGSAAFVPASEYFDAYQVSGKDGRGNVLFSAYFAPELEVSAAPTSKFRYPIYARPKGLERMPSRREIYKEGALEGKGLELGYANSLLDIQQMQLQGSGYVRFQNGTRSLLSYDGSNGHQRQSVQRYFLKTYANKPHGITLRTIAKFIKENPGKADEIIFHNPSYVFFTKKNKHDQVVGSGSVPLSEHISIASDKRFIPTGACLFADKPVPYKKHTEHKMSVMLAQDVGGAIKGPGRVDIYTGIGKSGEAATRLKNYGRMWLLLAK